MPDGLPDAPIGVVGAGTMGAGIAQVAAVGGLRVKLFDLADGAADGARERIAGFLERSVARGKLSAEAAAEAVARVEPVSELAEFSDCFLVAEAVAEKLEIKQGLFAQLAGICGESTVFATNTSSLPVTAVAAPVPGSGRVVGMHFFNPVPVMKLVEVIAGMNSDPAALDVARRVGRVMGREVIDANDGPGFLVNRVSRPFLLEAQQLLSEGLSDAPTVDRAARLGGGFRMGPFELSDLVGVDVGYDIAKSFYALGHGEPRWRPSVIPAQMVAGGRLGRKSGRGYYEYDADSPYRAEDPPPQMVESASGAIDVIGATPLAGELRRLAVAAGFDVNAGGDQPRVLTLDARIATAGDQVDPTRGPVAVLCAGNSLAAAARGRNFSGFHCLPPLGEARAVEVTRTLTTSDETLAATRHFFHAIGKHVIDVGDAPGLVLGRIVSQLINEASFALQEGVGSATDIDKGVRLGLNYPRGLFEWQEAIGVHQVVATLDALQREVGGDRYRVAGVLRRAALAG
ncbi:MAG: 3-hydroxyacyl-CoA dehydrogenase NAD-binding domain-containing protein [Solirubrobacterales bacterium]